MSIASNKLAAVTPGDIHPPSTRFGGGGGGAMSPLAFLPCFCVVIPCIPCIPANLSGRYKTAIPGMAIGAEPAISARALA